MNFQKLNYPRPDDRQDAAVIDLSCMSLTAPQSAQEHVESIACRNSIPVHHELQIEHVPARVAGLARIHNEKARHDEERT